MCLSQFWSQPASPPCLPHWWVVSSWTACDGLISRFWQQAGCWPGHGTAGWAATSPPRGWSSAGWLRCVPWRYLALSTSSFQTPVCVTSLLCHYQPKRKGWRRGEDSWPLFSIPKGHVLSSRAHLQWTLVYPSLAAPNLGRAAAVMQGGHGVHANLKTWFPATWKQFRRWQ